MSRLTSTWLFWLQYLICLENNIKNIHSEPKFWSFWRQRSAHQQFIKHLYKKHSVRAVANSLFVRNILWNSKSNPTFIARFISRKFKNDILATTCYIEEPFVTSLVQLSTIVIQNHGLETQLKSLCTHGHWTHCILV